MRAFTIRLKFLVLVVAGLKDFERDDEDVGQRNVPHGSFKLHAFDAASGKVLWEHVTNSGILAPPTSFLIDGKQYIAVHSGWGGDAAGDQVGINRLHPGEAPPVPEGGSVWVFALE